MWLFFDADKNYVGMFTEESANCTNIREVLIDAGYFVRKVKYLGHVDPDYYEEECEDEED